MKNKVAVIDDNESNLMLEKDLLEVSGFVVFTATNGADGIDLIKRERPDIIIMDVRLPDILGTEAVRRLRQDQETRDIPVVFVTASVLEEDKKKITPIPNSLFMSKPINTRTFVEEIRQFIKCARN